MQGEVTGTREHRQAGSAGSILGVQVVGVVPCSRPRGKLSPQLCSPQILSTHNYCGPQRASAQVRYTCPAVVDTKTGNLETTGTARWLV